MEFFFIVVVIILLGIFIIMLLPFLFKKEILQTIEKKLNESYKPFFEKISQQINNINIQLNSRNTEIREIVDSNSSIKNDICHLIELINEEFEFKKRDSKEIISKLENIVKSNNEFNIEYYNLLKNIYTKNLLHLQEKETVGEQSTEKLSQKETKKTLLQTDRKIISDQAGDIFYYLPFPDSKGFFWDDKKSTEIQNNSAFLMNLFEDNTKRAYFIMLTNNKKIIKNALLNPKAFLKPICEITGNLNGSSITILEKGELMLLNNKWTVLEGKKVKIKIF